MFTSLGAQWMFETDMRDNLLERSLKFDDGASTHLTFTPSTASTSTDRRKVTHACWVKRGNIGVATTIYSTTQSGVADYYHYRFSSDDKITIILDVNDSNFGYDTTAVFRDTVNWYHLVLIIDTTQSTNTDRVKLYVNGQLQTLTTKYSGGHVSQNFETYVMDGTEDAIGQFNYNSTTYFDGYMTQFITTIGQDNTIDQFGRSVNGVWLPKEYTDSCGYNGFILDFAKTSTGAEYTPPSSAFTDDADQEFKLVEASDGTTSFTDEEGASVSRVGNTVHSDDAAKFGSTSVYFDGSGDNLSVGGNGYLSGYLNGNNTTLEAWVYPTAYHYGWIMSYSTNQHYHGFAMNCQTSNAYLAYGGNNGGSVNSPINGGVFPALNQWYHIAMQRDGSGTISFLFNGELIGQHSNPGNSPSGTKGPFKIGSQHYYGGTNRSFFTGYMDEVRVSSTGSRHSFSYANSLGADASGRGNHFAPSGFVSTDVVIDNPDNNFATMLGGGLAEPSDYQSYSGGGTYTEGNLKLQATSAWSNGSSNFGVTSGKWYAECRIGAKAGSGYIRFGVRARPARTYDEYFWNDNGTGQVDGTTSPYSSRVGTYTADDILMVALDLENNAIYFGKNGTWENSATSAEIAAGTTTNAFVASSTIVPTGDGHEYYFYCQPHSTGSNITWNFGQDDTFNGEETTVGNTDVNGQGKFQYEPPSGFLAQCAANLEENIISANPSASAAPGDFFNTVLYTGNGYPASGTQSITGVGFKPDWVWIKNRDRAGYNHYVLDSLRGATKVLRANVTNDENTEPASLTSFDADGFSLGANNEVNYENDNIVAFCWKAGGAPTASNTGGQNPTSGSVMIDGVASTDPFPEADIYPTKVSVNTTSGFSIVQFTSNISSDVGETGTAPTIPHLLGKKPDWFIIKDTDGGSYPHWNVWHKGYQPDTTHFNYQLFLQTTNQSNNAGWHRTDSALTSQLFTPPRYQYNETGKTYICYLFTEVEGYSKFGFYKGTGNSDGVFVYTGFRPAWIMTKRADSSGNWYMNDTSRSPGNPTSSFGGNLYADLNNAESGNGMDILSNGFKIRNTDSSQNASGGTYVFMAFAEAESKQANAR